MRLHAAIFWLPLAAFAQTPPPDVDQALRARVTEFWQAHVDGTFRKAFDIVAEDTKEYYFATEKVRFKSFKIVDIVYSENFTQALVNLTGEREMKMRYDFPVTVVTIPMPTTWKIENGKWCWYEHNRPTWLTAMGPSDRDKLKPQTPAGGAAPPSAAPDLSQAGLAARANTIIQQSSINKSELSLPLDRPSSENVVFHNGQQGTIKLMLADGVKPAGLTAELDKTDVNAGENAVVKVHFEPPADLAVGAVPSSFTLRLIMEPFSREFPINVKFVPPSKPAGQ
jgi:hypothetical protein